jgi:membrane glycosyltransferase
MNGASPSLLQRRACVAVAAVLWTAAACWFLIPRLFRPTNSDGLDLIANAVFVLLMFTGSFNFALYVVGFFCHRATVPNSTVPAITTRTAIVMPVYHEDMERVFLGLRQTWLSARQAELTGCVDFFLLCDSTDPNAQAEEERTFQRLLPLFNSADAPAGRLFLLRRPERSKYKAGNIAHFLETHGHAYDFMLVLDADSVMTGEKIKRLIGMMQDKPRTAVIQSVIVPIRARTLFARAMQYGISRSLNLFGSGMYWFLGPDSVYWGHNAIIRVQPFMQYCNLPIMPGSPPLGGEIMSQDIVEAALLGREGWAVDWDVEPGGSFDELPANILTYGQRDRRWCQGNFQHFWLIFGDRMRFGHRLYFANGIMAYAAGPLLLLLVLIGFVQGLRGRIYGSDPIMVASFLGFFLTLMLVPKLLGYFSLPKDKRNPAREVLSSLIDFALSFLIAPALFFLHTQFVLGILCGKMVPWVQQSRNPEEGLEWRTAARMFWFPTLLGIVWTWATLKFTPSFMLYLAPILIGWIFSIPIVVFSSSPALGDWFAQRGLLRDNLSTKEIAELGELYDEPSVKPGSVEILNPLPARQSPSIS